MTGWDDDGIDGSFARRRWVEIHHDDVWRLYRRVMNRSIPSQWIDLGRTLLIIGLDEPSASTRAELAFKHAKTVGDQTALVQAAIESARAEVEDERRFRERLAALADEERLKTLTPEAHDWTTQPWPALTEDEQIAAVAEMRRDAADILARAGLALEPVETKYFLFYSDLPRRESAKWARQLDTMYRRLAERFELDADVNIFWGKAVIFVFRTRDRFRLVEAEAFGQRPAEWADGMCHPVGPKVFVNFYRRADDAAFATVLVHEASHGFMHRYRTPRRLPTWANEGFADYLASVLFRDSPIDRGRRRKGLRFIRRNGDVNSVLDMQYTDGTWPGPQRIGYDVSYLMVELMIRDRPTEFGTWVDAVKSGKDWQEALVEDFGVTREQLVDRFVRFYRVND